MPPSTHSSWKSLNYKSNNIQPYHLHPLPPRIFTLKHKSDQMTISFFLFFQVPTLLWWPISACLFSKDKFKFLPWNLWHCIIWLFASQRCCILSIQGLWLYYYFCLRCSFSTCDSLIHLPHLRSLGHFLRSQTNVHSCRVFSFAELLVVMNRCSICVELT